MRGQRLPLAVVLALALLWVPAAVRSQAPAGLDAALGAVDAQIAADFARDGAGGVSVGVMVGAKLVWTKHYGWADAEARRVATNDTDYRIGSITKQFTALMLLQLVEQGKLHLIDPLEQLVPEIRRVQGAWPGAPPITLLQVATMTSGLAREPIPPMSETSVGPLGGWQQKVLSLLPQTRYQYEPGTRYLYSNIGYATLGLALERAAGGPYTAYVTDRVLAPLGMRRSGFEPSDTLGRDLAHGYTRANAQAAPDRTGPDRELDGRGYRVPNGALFSTVNDLAKFAAWELGDGPEAVLKKTTQDANYARVYSGAGPLDSGYGIGFMAERRGTLTFIGHSGSTGGYLSAVFVHRPSKTAVIVLHNGDGGSFNPTTEATRALERLVPALAK